MDLLRSEWIKLRTIRVTYVLTIIAAVFPLLIVVLVAALVGNVDDFSGSDLVTMITQSMVLSALLLGVVSTLSITNEYGNGTIRISFAATPNRRKVLIAKGVVALVFSMAITTIVMLVAFAAGSTILSNRDASLSFDSHTNTALVGLILLSGMLCLLGYGLGLIIRNSAASVTLLVLWPLLLENLARFVLAVAKVKNPTTWLPYQSAMRMISTPDFDGGESGGLTTGIPLAIVVIVIIGVGIVINERRDA